MNAEGREKGGIRSLRILFVTLEDVSQHKGSSTHIREKVNAFRQRGHRVVLLGGSSGQFDFDDFRSIGSFRNRNGTVNYAALPAVFLNLVFKILRSSKDADVIYAREPVATFAAVLTKPIHRTKIIYEVNSLDNEEIRMKGNTIGVGLTYRIMSLLQRIDAKFSDKIIVITDRVKDYYRKRYKTPECRFMVQGVTTDLNKFRPIDDAALLEPLRDRWNIPEDTCVVTFIGNLSHWQDFDLLLSSARSVIEKNPQVRFLVIGEGSQKKRLEQVIPKDNLAGRVLLTGAVPHSEAVLYINISDICIAVCKELASGYSPMKLFEYFACGKPVVATRVGGYEIVEEATAGKLVAGNDPDGFASAVLSLVEDMELRRTYGENALRFAREHFGWDKVISNIEALMEEMGLPPR